MASKKQLKLIARLELARGMSNDIDGMKNFLHYFLNQLPVTDRSLCHRYLKAREIEIETFLEQAKASGWSNNN